MLVLQRPIVFLDLETTGLDTERDRIVEISMKEFLTDWRVGASSTRLVNPGVPIPPSATAKHGITDAAVSGKPPFSRIVGETKAALAGRDIAGYNVMYDVAILNSEFNRAGAPWDYGDARFVDICGIAKQRERRDLEWALQFYCGKKHVDAHRSASDVDAAIDVFAGQFIMYRDLPETVPELALYSNYGKPVVDISGKFTMNAAGIVVFAFGPHKDEAAVAHKDFLVWMMGKDFAADTKAVVRKLLNGEML